MSDSSPSNTQPSPLTEDQLVVLGEANMQLNQFHRAAKAAHRAYVGLLVFGVFTTVPQFVAGAGFSFTGTIMGLWMIASGLVEYWGEKNIRRLRPGVFKKLMINQLLLGAMFVVISGWWVLQVALHNKSEIGAVNHVLGPIIGGGTGGSIGQVDFVIPLILYVTYGSVGAFGLVCQGSMAFYYARREKFLQAYLTETPQWVVRIQQTQFGPGKGKAVLSARSGI